MDMNSIYTQMGGPEDGPPLLIIVMGSTGSGKTTFINMAGALNLRKGADLSSCTSGVEYTPVIEMDNRKIILIDAPGFDDSKRSDMEILNEIALSLCTLYKSGLELSGIVFTHRIADNKMGGTARKNFEMFKQLCGKEAFQNVVIATTFWSEVPEEVGDARETELKTEETLYQTTIDHGASMIRHDNTPESARRILRKIIDNHPLPLCIQMQLVDEQRPLHSTDAAMELDREQAEMQKRYEDQMEKLERDIKDEKDEMIRQIMEDTERMLKEKTKEIMNAKGELIALSKEFSSNMTEMEKKLKEEGTWKVFGKKKFKVLKKKIKEDGPAIAGIALGILAFVAGVN